MTESINTIDGDDRQFIEIVQGFLNSKIEDHNPTNIIKVHIDNWFGPKWFKFSGKTLGALGVWNYERPTIPPFVPNRVLSCVIKDGPNRQGQKLIKNFKLHVKQESGENLTRFARGLVPDSLLIWYSGNTISNGQGSIMLYADGGKHWVCTYLSLERKNNKWRLVNQSGMSRNEAMTYVESEPAVE